MFSWCCYDFANSSFTTLVVTFIYSSYFASEIAPDEDTGMAFWGYAVAVSALIIAFLSPCLGALADRGAYRKPFLLAATGLAVAGSVALYFPVEGEVFAALAWFVVANVAFELGGVFYNAYLPEIASADRIGRISGYGWGFGYVGGLLCMVVAMVALVSPDTPWFGFSRDGMENVRATNLLVAGWFLIFSVPIFLWVRDPAEGAGGIHIGQAFADLKATAQKIRQYRQIIRFLLARLVFNDGLVTVFAFAGIYASGTFYFSQSDIIVFGIVINVAAGLGAWVGGIMDDRRGGKSTIMVSLAALSVATLIAVFAPTRAWLWVAGIGIGIFAGPNQSASRSLMGRFVPERHQSESFGFFAFSGKATAFLGPLLLGILSEAYGQRVGVSVVVLFFLAGGALLWTVDEKEGIDAAQG